MFTSVFWVRYSGGCFEFSVAADILVLELEGKVSRKFQSNLSASPHCDDFYASDNYNPQVQLPGVWQRGKAAEDYSTFA